jgi:hypothetical protein
MRLMEGADIYYSATIILSGARQLG